MTRNEKVYVANFDAIEFGRCAQRALSWRREAEHSLDPVTRARRLEYARDWAKEARKVWARMIEAAPA